MEEKQRLLLQKFLADQCTTAELAAVHQLLEQEDMQNALDTIMQEQTAAEWDEPAVTDNHMQTLVDSRLTAMHDRINAREIQSIMAEEATHKPVIRMKFFRYAVASAVILLVAASAFWFTHPNRQQNTSLAYIEKTNSSGKPVRYVLPDSSSVYLAAGTTLKYPEYFTPEERSIQLQGEAFFEVQPDAQKPFVVHAGNTKTLVLGTSFKISAFAGETMEVAVATGKVAVSAATSGIQKEVGILTPGLKLTWDNNTGTATRSNIDIAGLTQWTTGELSFNEQPLTTVAATLERRYQVDIRFANDKLKNYKVSGTFSADEPVGSVLGMLGFVGKFAYKEQNISHTKQFTLYPSK